jgi:hypothetical protein
MREKLKVNSRENYPKSSVLAPSGGGTDSKVIRAITTG